MTTGLVLGHALILASFVSWMLAIGPLGPSDHTYPVFGPTAGAVGADRVPAYYILGRIRILNRFAAALRNGTAADGGLTTLVVRRCFQCAFGNA